MICKNIAAKLPVLAICRIELLGPQAPLDLRQASSFQYLVVEGLRISDVLSASFQIQGAPRDVVVFQVMMGDGFVAWDGQSFLLGRASIDGFGFSGDG
jgi:hypothetical protein